MQVIFSRNSEFNISTNLFKSQLDSSIESLEMVTEENLFFELLIVNSGELDPPIPGDVDPPQEVLEEQ